MVTLKHAPRVLASLVAGIFLSGGAIADVEWSLTPSVRAAVTYTDNVGLAPDALKDSQLTYQISPGVALRRQSPRQTTELDYRLRALFFPGGNRSDTTLNQLRFINNLAVVEDHLFLDVTSNITQQVINPAAGVPQSVTSNSTNQSEVATLRVRPRWEGQLGKFARATLALGAGVVEYDNPMLRDSKDREISVSLAGNVLRNRLTWGINYRDGRTEYDSNERIDLASGSLELGIRIGAKTELVLAGGADENSLQGDAGMRKIDGSFWQVGLRGTLDQFTRYDIRVGEKFFGESYAVSLSRARGRLSGELTYSEEATTIGREQLAYDNLFSFLSDVAGIELPTTDPELYVRKRLRATGTYEFAASTVTLALFTEDRAYLNSLAGDQSDGASGGALTYGLQPWPRTSVSFDLSWERFDLRNSDNNPQDIRLRARMNRAFGGGFALNVNVWRNERHATSAGGEYTENAVSIGLTKTF